MTQSKGVCWRTCERSAGSTSGRVLGISVWTGDLDPQGGKEVGKRVHIAKLYCTGWYRSRGALSFRFRSTLAPECGHILKSWSPKLGIWLSKVAPTRNTWRCVDVHKQVRHACSAGTDDKLGSPRTPQKPSGHREAPSLLALHTGPSTPVYIPS